MSLPEPSFHRPDSTARSIGTLSALGIISGLLSFGYTAIIAYHFGTSRQIEVFFAASALITIIGGLAQSSFLAEVFLPVYCTLRKERGRLFAYKSLTVLINRLILFFIPISIALVSMGFSLIKLIAPGFALEDQILGSWMFRALIPALFLSILQAFLVTLLNAERQFGKPELSIVSSVALRIIVIVSTVPLLGLWALVVGFVVNSFTNVVWMIFHLKKIGYRHQLIFKLDGFHANIVFKKVFSTSVSEISLQIYNLVINASLTLLPQGLYGVYKYVESLFFGVATIAIIPNTKVFFTAISETISEKKRGTRELIKRALSRNLAMVMLTSMSAFVAAEPLLRGLWRSALFHTEMIDIAANLMKIMFALLFATGLFHILRKTAIALDHAHALYFGLSISYMFSAVVAWISIRNWVWLGLIVSLICFRVFEMIVPWLILAINNKGLALLYPLPRVKAWALAGGFGILVGWLINSFTPQYDFLLTRLGSLSYGVILTGISVFIATSSAWLLGVPEVTEACSIVRGRLLRFLKT